MTKKTQRRTLVLSIIALAVCFAMLVGSTFAWFTDTVSSNGNIIKSGTLNIDLLVDRGDDGYVSVKQNGDPVFDYDRWEPGYTEWGAVKVVTTGNLALKYTMKIYAEGQVSKLAEVIDVFYAPNEITKPDTRPQDLEALGLVKLGTLKDVLDGGIETTVNDTLIPDLTKYDGTTVTDEDFASIVLHMKEEAGNEYQNLSIGANFKIQILATQYTYEEDSWDEQYDADAKIEDSLPEEYVAEIDGGYYSSLADAAAAATSGQTIKLLKDLTLGNNDAVEFTDFWGDTFEALIPELKSGVTLDGDGHKITAALNGKMVIGNIRGATVKNLTVSFDSAEESTLTWNSRDAVFDNVDLEGTISLNSQNNGAYVIYPIDNTTLTGCTNKTTIKTPESDTARYNGATFGYLLGTGTMTVKDYSFEGTMESGKAALLIGNWSYGTKVDVVLENVKNNGTIVSRATNYYHGTYNYITADYWDKGGCLTVTYVDGDTSTTYTANTAEKWYDVSTQSAVVGTGTFSFAI